MAPETEQAEAPTPAAPAAPVVRSRAEIAKELFGSEFKGKVEPAKAEPAKPEELSEEQAPPDDTQKGGEAPVEEPAEGERPSEEGGETAPAEATDETPIVTEAELVEHLGAPPEWFRSVKVPITVDGTPTEATIGDLVKSYQTTEAANHRLETAKSIAQKESEAWAAKHQEIDNQYRIAAELVKAAEANLERDVKAVDPKLRDQDPAEWAARIQEFSQKRAAIDQMKRDTVEGYKATQAAAAGQINARLEQYRVEQRQLLLQQLPELQDPERAETENAKTAEYLYRHGFSPEEFANLLDHRQWLIARKARLYDESRGQVETAKKKVATVPRIMKPGAPKPREQLASERLQALKVKMQKSGSIEDATAYRMAKRGVSP